MASIDPRVASELGDQAGELRAVRERIDAVDRAIVELLAERADLARRAASLKRARGVEVRDLAREAEILAERRRQAAELGLDPAALAELFDAILRFSRAAQQEPAPPADEPPREP